MAFGDGNSERARKVAMLSGRLRLVQAELADEKPDVRREQIDSEISRAIAGVAPQDREAFLRDLLSGFPIADGAVAVVGSKPAATKPEPEKPRDPAMIAESMADGLAAAWDSISADQKQAILAKLSKKGVSPPAIGGTLSEATVRELRGKLGLGTADNPDPVRVGEMAVLLLDLALVVDNVIWKVWTQKISPVSSIRSNGPLQRFFRDFVICKKDVPNASGAGLTPDSEIKRLINMFRGMMSAISQAGMSFGQKFMAQFSPSAIEDSVSDSGFGSKDAERWRFYKTRAASLDSGAIDAEITQSIAKFVEDWMKRAGNK